MRLSLLFLVLFSALLFENVNGDKLNIAPILQLGLRVILLNIKRQLETITLDDMSWTIPEEYKNISYRDLCTSQILSFYGEAYGDLKYSTGSINLKNVEVYGIQTLDIAGISANDTDPSNENYIINLCVNLLFGQLGLSTDYDADVGIIDEIPIYGDGKINLAVSQVIFDLCLNINSTTDFSKISVDDVVLSLELHDSPSYITRFWKSDSVSDIVTTIINLLEKILFMFMNYEKDCISNLISPIVQYALNSVLSSNPDDLVINSTCLQISLEEAIELDGTLQTLLAAYNEGRVANLISNTNVEEMKEVIKKMEENVLEILINEGFSIEA